MRTLLRAQLPALSKRQFNSTPVITFFFALYFTLFFNHHFLSAVAEVRGMAGLDDYLFMATALLFLLTAVNLLVSLFAFRYLFKPWLVLLLLTAAMAAYFVNSYGIFIDREMIRNIMETDVREATELFSWKLLLYFIVLGLIPSALVVRTPIRYASLPKELLNKVLVWLGSALVVGLIAVGFYQDYASLFRNHREFRNLIVPIGYVYASYSYTKRQLRSPPPALVPIGEDAMLGEEWTSGGKKVVTVVVVGETARAENFSLNGYDRETNAHLKQQDIIYFDNVHSCGTATAVSLPCMFSSSDRTHFDSEQQKYTENLLDVFRHAGLPVLWRDNNSGCKGLCSRVDREDLTRLPDSALCHDGDCYDMAFLPKLQEKIDAYDKGLVLVLHQKGSHGPAYFERVPKEAQTYTPYCHTNQLQQCTRSEIINAYDNTIAYTDYFLAKVIEFLKRHEAEYDASLIYVSDHGESLGESGVYLHGLPYAIAPEQQTHVPMLAWLSDGFAQRFHINRDCLAANRSQPYSHDNLFSSLLGMLDVRTEVYNDAEDLFRTCKEGAMLSQSTSQPHPNG